ncbi:MAG: hypothetical protein AAF563_21835 [Pseudomonadota bacterium]
MPTKEALRAEIRNLRAEIDEMRRAREEQEAAASRREWASATHGYDDDTSMSGIDDGNGLDDEDGETDDGNATGGDEHESQLKDIEKALGDLADEAGKEIAERPLVAVLAAFVLGVVAGRLLSR